MAAVDYVRGGIVEPHWLQDGNSFWYAEGAPEDTVIYRVDPVSRQRQPLFDVPRLRAALEELLGETPPHRGLPFDHFDWLDGERAVRFAVAGRELELRLADYQLTPASPVPRPRFVRAAQRFGYANVWEKASPDGRWLAGELGFDLALRAPLDDRQIAITSGGTQDFAWDVETARWSPDSKRLAVFKRDRREVHKVPVVHWLGVEESVDWEPLPKAGGALERYELYIVDVASRHAVRADLGDTRDDHFYPLRWRQDGREALVLRMDRPYRRLDLLAVDPESGHVRVVLTETTDTFLGALRFTTELVTRVFTPLADGEHFLWLSERDGWSHVYLYDYSGRLLRQVTHGPLPVLEVKAVDEAGGWVYVLANSDPDRPYDHQLLRTRLTGNDTLHRLTPGTGVHAVYVSPSYRFFVDCYSTPQQPPRSELRGTDGSLVEVLSEADISELMAMGWQAPEEFQVKAADGHTDLFGLLFRPPSLDPGRKYPVVDYIYNGPFTTWVPHTFGEGRADTPANLARHGFVVFMVDGRGTPERGKTFQDVVYRNFGRHEIPDHVATLNQLAASRPYLDLSRVGVVGGSWGGYMAIRAMLLAPEIFRVGIATSPLADLYDHEATGIEGYMGLVSENREGYEYASNLRLADRLEGKLLLIHSTSDLNATLSTTMKMAEALIRAGKLFDTLLLPEQTHMPEGISREYWLKAQERYLIEHLRP